MKRMIGLVLVALMLAIGACAEEPAGVPIQNSNPTPKPTPTGVGGTVGG